MELTYARRVIAVIVKSCVIFSTLQLVAAAEPTPLGRVGAGVERSLKTTDGAP